MYLFLCIPFSVEIHCTQGKLLMSLSSTASTLTSRRFENLTIGLFSCCYGKRAEGCFRAGFSAESIRALHLFVAIALCSLWWSRSWRGKMPSVSGRVKEGMRDGRGIMTNLKLICQASRIINENPELHENWSFWLISRVFISFLISTFFH